MITETDHPALAAALETAYYVEIELLETRLRRIASALGGAMATGPSADGSDLNKIRESFDGWVITDDQLMALTAMQASWIVGQISRAHMVDIPYQVDPSLSALGDDSLVTAALM